MSQFPCVCSTIYEHVSVAWASFAFAYGLAWTWSRIARGCSQVRLTVVYIKTFANSENDEEVHLYSIWSQALSAYHPSTRCYLIFKKTVSGRGPSCNFRINPTYSSIDYIANLFIKYGSS